VGDEQIGMQAPAPQPQSLKTRRSTSSQRSWVQRRGHGSCPWTLAQLRHPALPLPRTPATQLHVSQSYARFARGLAPFIVTGIMDHPAWAERERSTGVRLSHVTALAARFPDVRVDYYPHHMEASNVQPLFEALPTAVADLRNAAPRAATAAYPRSRASTARCLQWNMDAGAWRRVARLLGPLAPLFTSDEPWLDGCLGSDALRDEFFRMTHWRMLLVGTQEAGMFNHKDTLRTSSWQVGVGEGGGGCLWTNRLTTHATTTRTRAQVRSSSCRAPSGGTCARRRRTATCTARAR
jgi:hypothetical protein